MDSFVPLRDRNALNQPKKNLHNRTISTQVDEVYWNQMGCEGKKTAVDEKILRFNKLPPITSHASYLLRVLHKIRSLLPLQRTISDDEELELLFAGLSV